MIENGFTYLALLMTVAATLVYMEQTYRYRIFKYLPAIIILYFVVMLGSTFKVWEDTESIHTTYSTLKSTLLPAMIFLMLLSSDIRQIMRLGTKMIFTFFLASLSIALGFIITFIMLQYSLPVDAWKTFAALSGSWMGGTANMVAIQEALHIPNTAMGYTLLIDSIDYAIWVMILLALVPFAPHFNHWSKADTSTIDSVAQKLTLKEEQKASMDFASLFILLGLGILVSSLALYIASFLPTSPFITTTTWVIIIATLSGIIMAVTPLSKLSGSSELGNIMLYLMIALIASRADFTELTEAPLYIMAGFIILIVHLVLMVLFAKLFKLDLFILGVASLANIGGIASAPILASTYSKSLIPIGVLMAMIGYMIGTFGGLLVAKVLYMVTQL